MRFVSLHYTLLELSDAPDVDVVTVIIELPFIRADSDTPWKS